MGTRADFYIGRGEDAEWLGSIAWDGYPEGIDATVLEAADEAGFRAALKAMASERNDWTDPEMGWPWPWITSHTTDFAYAFDDGKVYACCFGAQWRDNPREDEFDDEDDERRAANGERPAVFPDMSRRPRVRHRVAPRAGIVTGEQLPRRDWWREFPIGSRVHHGNQLWTRWRTEDECLADPQWGWGTVLEVETRHAEASGRRGDLEVKVLSDAPLCTDGDRERWWPAWLIDEVRQGVPADA